MNTPTIIALTWLFLALLAGPAVGRRIRESAAEWLDTLDEKH